MLENVLISTKYKSYYQIQISLKISSVYREHSLSILVYGWIQQQFVRPVAPLQEIFVKSRGSVRNDQG